MRVSENDHIIKYTLLVQFWEIFIRYPTQLRYIVRTFLTAHLYLLTYLFTHLLRAAVRRHMIRVIDVGHAPVKSLRCLSH